MNNNIGIIIGAIIISLTVFFTFNKEPQVIESKQISGINDYEYRSLKNKLASLQHRLASLHGESDEINRLRNEIDRLKGRLSSNDNQIKDKVKIYDFLNDVNAKPIHNNLKVTKNGTPYIIYSHDNEKRVDTESKELKYSDIRIEEEVIPPVAPGLALADVSGEIVYYQSQPSNKDISVLTVSAETGEEELTEQSSINTFESSPPVPPALFEGDSNMPSTGN